MVFFRLSHASSKPPNRGSGLPPLSLGMLQCKAWTSLTRVWGLSSSDLKHSQGHGVWLTGCNLAGAFLQESVVFQGIFPNAARLCPSFKVLFMTDHRAVALLWISPNTTHSISHWGIQPFPIALHNCWHGERSISKAAKAIFMMEKKGSCSPQLYSTSGFELLSFTSTCISEGQDGLQLR